MIAYLRTDRESYTVELAVCVELEQWCKAKTLSLYGARLTAIRKGVVFKQSISEIGKESKKQRNIWKNVKRYKSSQHSNSSLSPTHPLLGQAGPDPLKELSILSGLPWLTELPPYLELDASLDHCTRRLAVLDCEHKANQERIECRGVHSAETFSGKYWHVVHQPVKSVATGP